MLCVRSGIKDAVNLRWSLQLLPFAHDKEIVHDEVRLRINGEFSNHSPSLEKSRK